MMRIFEMSDQGFTIFSYFWLLNHTPTTPHSMKPQIKKLLRVVEVSTLVSHRKLYRKVSTERKHTWKYPATYNETSCSRPSPFTRSPKHGHPQLPSHHPASLKKKKKKLLNIDFYNVCFADNVSPEYHEITNFSYKVLMQF